MLSRAKKLRAQAITAYNAEKYDEAIQLFKESRGQARNALNDESRIKHYQVYGLLVETSLAISECLLKQEKQETTEFTEALVEAETHLSLAKDSAKKAHNKIGEEDIKLLEHSLHRFSRLMSYIYWNRALDKHESFESKILEAENLPTPFNQEQCQKSKDEIRDIMVLFSKALHFSKKAHELQNNKEILEKMNELYEGYADFFSTLADDEVRSELKLSLLDIALEEYLNAFHVLEKNHETSRDNITKLAFSVLNALETKGLFLENLDDAKNKAKLENACTESLKFAKKYLSETFVSEMTAPEKLELHYYLFNAHRLLSTHCLDIKKSAAHFKEAEKIFKQMLELYPIVAPDTNSAIYASMVESNFFIHKGKLNEIMQLITQHPSFSQNTVAQLAHMFGRIHGDFTPGRLADMFHLGSAKMDRRLFGISYSQSFELLEFALSIATEPKMIQDIQKDIAYLKHIRKKYFEFLKEQNPQARLAPIATPTSLSKEPLTSEKSTEKLNLWFTDYLINIELMYGKEKMVYAIPRILKHLKERPDFCLKDPTIIQATAAAEYFLNSISIPAFLRPSSDDRAKLTSSRELTADNAEAANPSGMTGITPMFANKKAKRREAFDSTLEKKETQPQIYVDPSQDRPATTNQANGVTPPSESPLAKRQKLMTSYQTRMSY